MRSDIPAQLRSALLWRVFMETVTRDSNRTAMAELTHIIDSEVFLAFSTYATIVVLKMMLMSPMTAYFRFTRKMPPERPGEHHPVRSDWSAVYPDGARPLHCSAPLPGVCWFQALPHGGLRPPPAPTQQRSSLDGWHGRYLLHGIQSAKLNASLKRRSIN
ncbi:uncharacterized protein LOC109885469 isoform X2 [Oncorhynchus kisutch]|uniref:uncharacterized protein LOC109885469 isoform X2 n=1 Tax=Oncorhynchus kisutch TaxID=8019 RepID=UPI0012DBF410|nr:uncharacterized protein LOC109885469 isoform X2 [Oncorhynchus kisutch]